MLHKKQNIAQQIKYIMSNAAEIRKYTTDTAK
jgi:hypothetical protein